MRTAAPTIGVMAKAPSPGACKTRLAYSIGNVRAAELYEAMLLDTLAAYSALAFSARVVFAAPEHNGVAVLRRMAPRGWSVVEQKGADLGARLLRARAALGDRAAILASSDSPTAPFQFIATAIATWNDPYQVLLGPCIDGGYYLIGLGRCETGVFEGIPWSTHEVALRTKQRCANLGLTVRELPQAYDVDDHVDLARLRLDLGSDPLRAPRTAAALRAAASPPSYVVPGG